MTTYYVRTNGDDGGSGHDGTTPALAWLTIGYAMTHVSAGDTIWVGGGTYRVSTTIAPSSMASMTYLYADPDGSHTGDAGEVLVTNYGTNDTTAPAAVNLFTFSTKNFWTLRGFTFYCGNIQNPVLLTAASHDITFQDCTFLSGSAGISLWSLTWAQATNLIVERCRIFALANTALYLEMPNSATGSETNLNILIRNCIIATTAGYPAVQLVSGGTATAHKSGGVTVFNCFIMGGNDTTYGAVGTSDSSATYFSTTYPCTVYNSLILGNIGLKAPTSGTGIIVEDYNVIVAGTARTNVAVGANSTSDFSKAWRFSLGHEGSYGGVVRAFGEFVAGSPLLAFGGSTATGYPTDDLRGVTRPASGAASLSKALGPLERSDSATKETSTIRSGSTAIKFSGPGYQDFSLPVVASGGNTIVTVYGRYDGSYGAGTKPTMSVRNGEEAGVAAATTTMVGTSNNWEQLSLTLTPTSTGIVTIRLASLGSAAAGSAFFDDFAVS